MNLSERLEQARKQRLVEAGLLPSEAALKPEPPEIDPLVVSELFEPITIEVAPTGLAPVAEPSVFRLDATTGRLCPSCNNEGRVDLVDLVGHRNHMTCTRCGAMWQVRTDERAEA